MSPSPPSPTVVQHEFLACTSPPSQTVVLSPRPAHPLGDLARTLQPALTETLILVAAQLPISRGCPRSQTTIPRCRPHPAAKTVAGSDITVGDDAVCGPADGTQASAVAEPDATADESVVATEGARGPKKRRRARSSGNKHVARNLRKLATFNSTRDADAAASEPEGDHLHGGT